MFKEPRGPRMESILPVSTLERDITSVSQDTARVPAKLRPFELPHIRELDGVRGIAALAVVFHHLCYTSIDPRSWGLGVRVLSHVSEFGRGGVDLFFVLSGFLITSILLRDRTKPAYYSNFYWRRALRILPLYFLCLAGVYLFVPHSGSYVLLSALFLVNFAQLFHVGTAGPFWTLAIEEHFYLLWPTVVRGRSIDVLARWCIWIVIAVNALRIGAAFFGHRNYSYTFFYCDGLAIGAFLACRRDRYGADPKQQAIPTSWIAWAGITGLALICAGTPSWNNPILDSLAAAAHQCGLSLIAGSVIAIVITRAGSPSLAILRSGFFTFFGLISYAVYMTHMYVMMAYDHLRPVPPGSTPGLVVRFLVIFGVTTGLSTLSLLLVERPALSLRRLVLTPETAR